MTKSAAMKLLEGNRGKRKIDPSTDVSFEVGAPTPPASMKGDALEHWKWLVEILVPARVLTPADFGIMLVVSNSYAQMMKLQRACDKKRSIVYTEKGSKGQVTRKSHHEFELLLHARRSYMRALAELGLTPASRNRVKAMPSAKKEGIGEFFRK